MPNMAAGQACFAYSVTLRTWMVAAHIQVACADWTVSGQCRVPHTLFKYSAIRSGRVYQQDHACFWTLINHDSILFGVHVPLYSVAAVASQVGGRWRC